VSKIAQPVLADRTFMVAHLVKIVSVCLLSVCDACIVAKQYVVGHRRWYR